MADAYGWKPWQLHVLSVLKSRCLNLLKPSGTVQACTGIASPLICIANCFISFNCSLEPSSSFRYKAVSIVVTLPDLQFKRHLICGAYSVKFYNTATVTIATCVHVQNIEVLKGGFVKPDNKLQPNSLRVTITNFCMSFSCHLQRYVIHTGIQQSGEYWNY